MAHQIRVLYGNKTFSISAKQSKEGHPLNVGRSGRFCDPVVTEEREASHWLVS